MTALLVLGLACAVVMGLSLGILGGGGAILTVPVLVYVLGVPAKESIAMSVAIVGVVSAIGAIGHWHARNLDLRTVLIFGPVSMVGAFIGAKLSVYLSGTMQLAILGTVMLVASGSMFRSASVSPASATGAGKAPPSVVFLGLIALAVGMLTGLIGVGGGFLLVPALVLLARMPMKLAVGTSLAVIAMNSISGFLGYQGTVAIRWGLMIAFIGLASIGILTGARLIDRVPQAALKRGFAVFLVVCGAFILYKNRGAFFV